MTEILFLIKRKSNLDMNGSEIEKLIRKILEIVNINVSINNDLEEADIYRTALFQTYDVSAGLPLLIKNRINECPVELYNIASIGDTKRIVSETIKAIEKYAPTDKLLIIFIANINFIPEFVRQRFKKKLRYGMVTGRGNLKSLNTTNLKPYSA